MENGALRHQLRVFDNLAKGIGKRRTTGRKEWVIHDIATGDQTRLGYPEHYPKKTDPVIDWASQWKKDTTAKAKIIWE